MSKNNFYAKIILVIGCLGIRHIPKIFYYNFMYLKRIEIAGFKSFAHKTNLEFEKEISAVVGPNGSGKSNVADAVRWAIGEQSTKALRVKKSENLVFSGHTASVGKASVSLYFDNTDHKFPVDFDEVVITRQLYKNGDTEFIINGSKARLLDVLELLAAVGINPKSYSVVSQGMADAILRATPEERRNIFEDAAGVKPYKIKRNEATRKLDLAEQNLIRVNDLLAEISPRLIFLRRQAAKAQKLVVVKAELEEALKKWYSFNLNNFEAQKKDIVGRRNAIDKVLNEAVKKLNELFEKMNLAKTTSGDTDNKQEELRRSLEDIQEKIDGFIKNIAIAETRLKIEEERKEKIGLETIAIDFGYIKAKISEIYDNVNLVIGKISEVLKDPGAAKTAEGNLKNVEKRLKKLLDEIVSGKVPIDEELTNKQRKEKEEAIKRIADELSRLKGELVKVYAEKDAIKKKISEEVVDDKTRRSEFFSLQEEIRRAENAANKLREDRQVIVIEETKISTRFEDLQSEIKVELNGANFEDIRKINAVIENEAETRSKIDKLKREYIQIGGIDPAVVDEFKETEERYNFLSKELQDVTLAISDLKKVISQLDEKIEEQFNEIFKKINFEFNKYFRIIFGGGGAALEAFEVKKNESVENIEGEKEADIEEKDKKREKGINIKVTIPGKKIRDLETLSGGERALTSSAALFAIISSNPPPFVVLDEIDAALDESNSFKLAEIIEQIGNETQFIVITHNRAMMRKAKTVYGVSMTDESISKIISVKFDDIK